MSLLNARVFVPRLGCYGDVVGYEDERLQLVLDGRPIDEPEWVRRDEVEVVCLGEVSGE